MKVHTGSNPVLTIFCLSQYIPLSLSKINNMKDFKVCGTKLPIIPKNTTYRIRDHQEAYDNKLSYDLYGIVSYGSRKINDEIYILAERPNYKFLTHFMFKELDIINIETQKLQEIISYKLIKPEYKEAAENIMGHKWSKDITNHFIVLDEFCVKSLRNAGVLDLWFEPIYKKKELIISDSQGRTAKVEKDKLIVEDSEIYLKDLKLIRDRYDLIRIGNKGWYVQFVSATFNIGCWKNITLDDINNAIKAIESI